MVILRLVKSVTSLYTYATLPVYYAAQRPWRAIQKAKRVRAIQEDPSDPYSPWIRNIPLPSHYTNDCKTLAEAQQKSLKVNGPDVPILGYRKILEEKEIDDHGKLVKKLDLSHYHWLTFGEADQLITNISRGLLLNGVKPKDTVLIFAETRLEWFLSASAIMRMGAAITTLYATLGVDGVVHGINEVGVTHVITTEDLLPKLGEIKHRIPKVKTIIYVEFDHKQYPRIDFGPEINLVTFKQLEKDGSEAPKSLKGVDPTEDDIALIQYTSGSTGIPKGVIVTHKQIMANFKTVYTLMQESMYDPRPNSYLAYLPLSHILEFSAELFMYNCGVKIGYGSPLTLTNSSVGLKEGTKGDIYVLKPTYMLGVPLVLERIRKGIEQNLEKRSPLFQQLFDFSINYKTFWRQKGYNTPIIDRLVFNKLKSQIGGKLEYMIVGGAPLNPDTHKFISTCLNFKIGQGYGTTETTSSNISQDFDDLTYCHIGSPLHGVRVRLIDWREGGYCVKDKPNSRGEAVIGGDSVAIGYHKLEDEAKEAFEVKDGIRWFKTGDILEVNSDGVFKVIDRKKDFIKLQFGEYISLGKVETELINCHYVENICIYGDSYHSFLIALVLPNQESLRKLAKELLPGADHQEWEQLCENKKIIDFVLNDLQGLAQRVGLNKMEIPAKIKLCAEEWTPSNSLVTPALKIKRKNIKDYYKQEIDGLYATV